MASVGGQAGSGRTAAHDQAMKPADGLDPLVEELVEQQHERDCAVLRAGKKKRAVRRSQGEQV